MMTASRARYLPALLLPLLLLTAGQLSAALSGRAISAGSTLVNPFSLLADMELSRAYGATGLTYPLVVFGSAFFLREQTGIRHMAGFLIWNSGP